MTEKEYEKMWNELKDRLGDYTAENLKLMISTANHQMSESGFE